MGVKNKTQKGKKSDISVFPSLGWTNFLTRPCFFAGSHLHYRNVNKSSHA